MKLDLYYFGEFENEFQGKKYNISSWVDPKSLVVLTGTNLKSEKPFIKYEKYVCKVDLKGNKIKVVDVL